MSRTNATPKTERPGRWIAIVVALGVLLAFVAVLRLSLGATGLGWPEQTLILELRGTRLALGVIVGVALAISGVALQALLRNPLAEPFILGLSTGAGAGIMLQALVLHWVGIVSLGWLGFRPIGALAGACAAMGIVYLASRRRGMIDPLGLLLTGVVLSTINGALIMMGNYLAGPGGLRDDLSRWMMGYLNEAVSGDMMIAVAGLCALCFTVLLVHAFAMDAASVSDTEARAMGVNLKWLRTVLFLTAGVLAAGAVLLAGPIAFVGLVAPHIGRLLLGPSHGPLLIASAMIGAILIVAADLLSTALDLWMGIGLMPIGIFTALVGGVVFLWMLHPQLGRGLD